MVCWSSWILDDTRENAVLWIGEVEEESDLRKSTINE